MVLPQALGGVRGNVEIVLGGTQSKVTNATYILLPDTSGIYQLLSILLRLSWSKPQLSLQWIVCKGFSFGLPAHTQQTE